MTLLANFVNGFADGWKMAVHEAFREALDIKWRFVKRKGEKGEYAWTQGYCFNFKHGDVVHNSINGALGISPPKHERQERFIVQIDEAISCTMNDNKINPGYVRYSIYLDQGPITKAGTVTTTQFGFVFFFYTGIANDGSDTDLEKIKSLVSSN